MDNLVKFNDFFVAQFEQISIFGFIINMILAAVLSNILSKVYIKFGNALSNRAEFAKNFMMLSMTTLLIITIVQSSLALSLGLIGALSIVRFRAAIKEPEELSFLFLTIAIGLGLGANQAFVTIVAVIVIIGIIWIKNRSVEPTGLGPNLYLTVSSKHTQNISLENVASILEECCSSFQLKRTDNSGAFFEALYLLEFRERSVMQNIDSSLRKLDEAVQITFLDHRGGPHAGL